MEKLDKVIEKMKEFRRLLNEDMAKVQLEVGHPISQNDYASNWLKIPPPTFSAWFSDDRRFPSDVNLAILSQRFGPRVFKIFDREPLFPLPEDPKRRAIVEELLSGEVPPDDIERMLEITERLRAKRRHILESVKAD